MPEREFLWRFVEGYGSVVAVVGDGPSRFIYLAGEPPDRVREACEGQQKQLVSLVAGQGREPVTVARSVVKRAERALRWCLDQVQDLLLKRPDAADPNRSGGEGQRSVARPTASTEI